MVGAQDLLPVAVVKAVVVAEVGVLAGKAGVVLDGLREIRKRIAADATRLPPVVVAHEVVLVQVIQVECATQRVRGGQ